MVHNNAGRVTSSKIGERMQDSPIAMVWTPGDFLDLGGQYAVHKALQRMVTHNQLRRIDRGLYDQPRVNKLTDQLAAPDYRMVIDAVGRRDQARLLIDGMTAANDLGLTTAVPGKVVVHTDARLRPIQLDQLILTFKLTAPSKLYWAGRPAVRIVQSLHWFRDGLKTGSLLDEDVIQNKILRLLRDKNQGADLRDDLILGLGTLPAWMQDWIRHLLVGIQHENAKDQR